MYRINEKEKKLRFIPFVAPLKLIVIWLIVSSLSQPTIPAELSYINKDEKRTPQVVVSLLLLMIYSHSFVAIIVRDS